MDHLLLYNALLVRLWKSEWKLYPEDGADLIKRLVLWREEFGGLYLVQAQIGQRVRLLGHLMPVAVCLYLTLSFQALH